MISFDDYQSMQETAFLMQSITNASRLSSAIAQLEAGLGVQKELIEE